MRDLLTNYALIITAILSLIGVSIAAILNYCSNIKTNKARIISEEKRAQLPYLNEIFHVLNDAHKELNENNRNLTVGLDRQSAKAYLQNAYAAMQKLKDIEPYLTKSNRDNLMARYDDINSRINEAQLYYVNSSDRNEIEYKTKVSSINVRIPAIPVQQFR